jgi:SmpA / OmlA family
MRYVMVLLFLSLTVLAGCATFSEKMNELSIGMTKEQVIEVLGQPASTSAKDNLQYMKYKFRRDNQLLPPQHFVRLVDGKVDAYGRIGDFDSTKPLETRSTIDLNIQK